MYRSDDKVHTVRAAGQNTSHLSADARLETRKKTHPSSAFRLFLNIWHSTDTACTIYLSLNMLPNRHKAPTDTTQHEQSTYDCCTALTKQLQLLHSMNKLLHNIDEAVTIAA